MNERERISYATLAFQVDFAKIGRLDVWTPDMWFQSMLPRQDVDPEGYHKHLGVLPPALTAESTWVISICPEMICEHVKNMTDEELTRWILFLIAHLQMHLIVVDWAITLEPLDEIDLDAPKAECRVNEELEAVHPELFHFGEMVKRRVEHRRQNRF